MIGYFVTIIANHIALSQLPLFGFDYLYDLILPPKIRCVRNSHSVSVMASKRDSESLVVGIQLALKGEAVRGDDGFFDIKEVEKEIQFDFKKPLQHALKSVFDHGGKVVLAFPDSTHAQVSWL